MRATAPRLTEPFQFTLRVAPGSAEDFEQWRFGVAPMFAMDAADAEGRASFALDGTAYQFPGLSVSSVSSSPTVFDRNRKVVARGGMDQVIVQAYLAGGYRLTVEGQETEVRAGDICVYDMTRPCLIRATSYLNITIIFARAALEPLVADIGALHGVILPHGSPLNTLLLSHMRLFYAEAPSLGNAEGIAAARATEGLIAACLGPSASGRDAARHATAVVAIQRLRRLIEVHLGDPDLGPDFLCRQGGVSRATLYRLFEPFGGVSNFIRQRRLARAFRMLSDPLFRTLHIHALAARCGFASYAAFSRALRQTYGMSPSDIRAGAGFGHASQDSGDGTFFALNRWLRGIDVATQ